MRSKSIKDFSIMLAIMLVISIANNTFVKATSATEPVSSDTLLKYYDEGNVKNNVIINDAANPVTAHGFGLEVRTIEANSWTVNGQHYDYNDCQYDITIKEGYAGNAEVMMNPIMGVNAAMTVIPSRTAADEVKPDGRRITNSPARGANQAILREFKLEDFYTVNYSDAQRFYSFYITVYSPSGDKVIGHSDIYVVEYMPHVNGKIDEIKAVHIRSISLPKQPTTPIILTIAGACVATAAIAGTVVLLKRKKKAKTAE